MATTAERPVRVAFIGTGAVTAYHHLPGLAARPPGRADGDLRRRPRLARATRERVGRPVRLDRPGVALPTGGRRRRRHRHAERHAPADRRGRGPGGQARHVREAARALERRRGAGDVRGRPRRRRRPHDGVHLPLRPVDAIPPASARNRERWGRPGTSDRSGSSTGPRRAGAGGSTRHGPAPATCST